VAEEIAHLRGVSLEEIGTRTTQNAREFFRFAPVSGNHASPEKNITT
jgi:hypothetical protein